MGRLDYAAGHGLAGVWQGSLKPSPILELRLVLADHLTRQGQDISRVLGLGEETFNPAALKLVSDWIRAVTGR